MRPKSNAPVCSSALGLGDETREFHRLIAENVGDLIAVLDTEGRRLYNNPAYALIFGDRKLEGIDSVADIHPEDRARIREVFRQTVATGVGQRAEFRFVLPGNVVRHIESQGNVIRDESGKPNKLVVISRDVTDRVQTEQELRAALADAAASRDALKAAQAELLQSEKLQAVGAFAATIGHEIKNPLQTILLGVEYLKGFGAAVDENDRVLLEEMSASVERCNAIVHGLLEFSTYNKQAAGPHCFASLLREAARAHHEELSQRGIKVAFKAAAGLPPLRLDHRSMKHVLIRLVGEAARTLGPGATLEIDVRRELCASPAPGSSHNKPADRALLVAEIIPAQTDRLSGAGLPVVQPAVSADFTFLMCRKIIHLYGGSLERGSAVGSFRLSFTL